MKYLTKTLVFLIVVSVYSASNAQETGADIGVFIADKSNSHGARIGIFGGNSVLWRGDILLSNNLGGIGGAIGTSIGPFKLYLGATEFVTFDPIKLVIDFDGDDVLAESRDGEGSTLYLEGTYKNYFIRYNDYEVTHDYVGSKPDSTGTRLLYKRGSDTSTGSIVWFGYNIQIQ